MAWTIEYADTAKAQLRKLDKQMARRIVDFMEERAAERIHLMAELAALRHITLKELATQLRQKRYADAEA